MSKAEEWRACLEKSGVMKFGPIDKKPYYANPPCKQVPIKIEY